MRFIDMSTPATLNTHAGGLLVIESLLEAELQDTINRRAIVAAESPSLDPMFAVSEGNLRNILRQVRDSLRELGLRREDV
jgi:hypothetical protein